MNLCFVSREFPPAPCGGIGTYLANIAPLLAQAGHTVHIVTEWTPGAERREALGNLTVHRLAFRDHTATAAALHPEIANRPGYAELFEGRDPMAVFGMEAARYLDGLARSADLDLIEAQEFEAPLYFRQTQALLRENPPRVATVVHLHSPSLFCDHHNHENPLSRQRVHRYHYEASSIALADALVCPSAFLARQAESAFGLAQGAIRVIHLPVGDAPEPSPTAQRIAHCILYTGRLERRKGIDLLVEAARILAPEFPDLHLRLIGGDTHHAPKGRNWSELLPRDLLDAGAVEWMPHRDRADLWAEYAQAAVCCYPSRWENFPNTCIEAMASGAPVVASRHGGMAEMIEDAESGFLCDPDSPRAIADALRHALGLTPEERNAIGQAAATHIRALCDNTRIAEERVAFYEETINKARRTTPAVPAFYPHPDTPLKAPHARKPETDSAPSRAGTVSVVVPCYNLGAYLDDCVGSILVQTRKAHEILIVDDGSTDSATRERLAAWESHNSVQVLRISNSGLANARNAGAAGTTGDYLVFLDADDTMRPTYLEQAARILDRHPQAAVASPWVESFGDATGVWCPPHAQFPFLLAENTVATASMVRRTAYDEAGGFKPVMRYGYEDWEFWITVAEAGWAILALPEPLICYRVREGSMLHSMTSAAHAHLRRTMLDLHPELFARYGAEVALIVEQRYQGWPQDYTVLQKELADVHRRLDRIRRLPTHPIEALRFIIEKTGLRLRRRPHGAKRETGTGVS